MSETNAPSPGFPEPRAHRRRKGRYFSAVLHPHRSLPPKGFTLLMAVLGGASFLFGLAFLLNGAWPVFGFFGLDVALVYWAFRANYRAARLYETIELGEDDLTVRRVPPRGPARSWRFQPYWVRVNVEEHPSGANALRLVSHGRSLAVGGFLSPDEKRALAGALNTALETWRRRMQPA